ncbi:MAG: hypothetical protein WC373_01800 [Smithella sp.]|jgi:hypothetical protein
MFDIYYDPLLSSRVDSAGGNAFNMMQLYYQTKPTWNLNFVAADAGAGTVTAIDLSNIVSWEAAVAQDFTHDLVSGAMTADKTGAVTEIIADGFASEPADAGFLTLINGAGETEDIAYTSWTELNDVYTFVVDATLTYSYLNNDVCKFLDTPPMLRISNSDIDDTDKATGLILVTLDTDFNTFLNGVTGQTNGYRDVYFRIKGYNVSGTADVIALFKIRAYDDIDPNPQTPPGLTSNLYTKAQIDALLTYLPSTPVQTTITDDTTTYITLGVAATYRAFKVEFTIDVGTNYRKGSVDVWHNGTLAYVMPGGENTKPSAFAGSITYGADISGGNVRLAVIAAGVGASGKMVTQIISKLPVTT